MIFVPSARPPHKRPDDHDPIAPADLRLAWVEAAVADNPRFSVDPIEVLREGPSYLVDTLRSLAEKLAPARPVFTLGCDAFREMETWRDPETLLTLASFAVTTRPPRQRGALSDWFPAGLRTAFELAPDGLSAHHKRAGTWVRGVEITALDISASSIRRQDSRGGFRSLPLAGDDPPRGRRERVLRGRRRDETEGPLSQSKPQRDHLAKAARILEAALERNAQQPVVLDVHGVTSFADVFVLLSGRSDRQVRAIADAIALRMREEGDEPLGIEGMEDGRWVLIDCNDVIVHVFEPEMRDVYALERLWSDAPSVDLRSLGFDAAALEAAGASGSGSRAVGEETTR